jgi:hypothetical protein
MVDLPSSGLADSTGTCVVTLAEPQGGLRWIIWQMTVETIPVRSGAQATIRRNGRYITSTISASGSSAQGPPALAFNPGDVITVTWTGMTQGDECIVTTLYEEAQAGGKGSQFGLV